MVDRYIIPCPGEKGKGREGKGGERSNFLRIVSRLIPHPSMSGDDLFRGARYAAERTKADLTSRVGQQFLRPGTGLTITAAENVAPLRMRDNN